MSLGVAKTINTEHIQTDSDIGDYINIWLYENPDVEVIDIKFSASQVDGTWGTDALIIYRTK